MAVNESPFRNAIPVPVLRMVPETVIVWPGLSETSDDARSNVMVAALDAPTVRSEATMIEKVR